MRFRWAQARRFPVTFLRFHSLSEDLEKKPSDRWPEPPKQNVLTLSRHNTGSSGQWGMCHPPRKNLFPIFHGCLTINHNHISLFFFLFSFSCSALTAWNQSQEKQDPATERVNCSRLTFSNELIVFTTLMRWNKHIRVAGCHVWGLVFKSVSECMRASPQISPGD